MTAQTLQPTFDSPDLVAQVAQLDEDSVHALPFGVIRLDARGRVVFFSRREAQLSGMGTRPAIGKVFFTELAPCMNTSGVRAALDDAIAAGDFDLEFDHLGDFADAMRRIRIRALPDGSGGVWLFTARD